MAVNLEVAAKIGKPLICASFPDATRKGTQRSPGWDSGQTARLNPVSPLFTNRRIKPTLKSGRVCHACAAFLFRRQYATQEWPDLRPRTSNVEGPMAAYKSAAIRKTGNASTQANPFTTGCAPLGFTSTACSRSMTPAAASAPSDKPSPECW